MQALNILSSTVIILAVAALTYKFIMLVYKLVTNSDLTVTNTKTGKSIKIGLHGTENTIKKLLEVIN